ncbi:MAG: hypothetical protein IJF65_08860 [Clostridia bacterium]|nr:hypothetical protein [Clostridia bacterium]
MKRICLVLLLLMILSLPAAQAEGCACGCSHAATAPSPVLQGNQALIYEAVRLSNALPKDAQVISALDYACKLEGIQLHLLLIQVTQSEHIAQHFGVCSQILIVDPDTQEVFSYLDLTFPEGEPIVSKTEALRYIYGGYEAYLQGYNPFIYSDAEITYPLTDGELTAINEALQAHFLQ